jgi:hypothetical protein
MLDLPLDVGDAPAGIALVPGPVELLGCGPELNDQVAGQVLRLGLTALSELDQGRLVAAHDNPGVRAANEGAAVFVGLCPRVRFHASSSVQNGLCKHCSGSGT